MKFFSAVKNTAKFFKNQMWGATPAYDANDQKFADVLFSMLTSLNPDTYSISPEQAMRQATVYACVALIADNIAQLPLHLYENVKKGKSGAGELGLKSEGGRRKAKDHPLYNILRKKPNNWQTPFDFYRFLVATLLLRGMACFLKIRVAGKLASLVPIPPDQVTEVWEGNSNYFRVNTRSGVTKYDPDDIFYVKGMSLDGKTAVSPITYAAHNIGISLDAGSYTSKFYKNGARPSGILTTSQSLSAETAEEMKKNWVTTHGGSNSGGTAVLWGGMDYKPITMSNQDAQLLELMGFQRTEIAAIFRVPPHMVGAVDKTSSWGTGVQEQKQSFLTFTLQPEMTNIEQAVSRDLLNGPGDGNFYAEFLTDKFLQSNQKDRMDSYKAALGGTQHPGFMTVNEIRRRENLPPLHGGDKLYSPVSPTDKESEQTEAL